MEENLQKIYAEVDFLKLHNRDRSLISGGIGTVITAILLSICVILFAFYTYKKSLDHSLTPKSFIEQLGSHESQDVKEAQVAYSFNYDSKEKPVFAIYKDYIVKCSSSGIWFLDKTGEVVWSENITFFNPTIKVNGAYLLVFDTGSLNVCVIKDKAVIWKDKLDEEVVNADIGKDGSVVIITESKRDNNEVRVFNSGGIEIFRKIIASEFAVTAGVSPSSNVLAVSLLTTAASEVHTNYKFYDMKGNDLSSLSFEESSEILPIFCFNSDKSLFAFGDTALAYLDRTGKIIWEKQFTNVFGACLSGNKVIAAAVKDSKGDKLILYDITGEEVSSCELQSEPDAIDSVKGLIAVNMRNTVYFFNSDCKNVALYSDDTLIQKVFLFSKHQAVIITNDNILVLNIS